MSGDQHSNQGSASEKTDGTDIESGRPRFVAEHQLRSELGPMVGPASCATLGAAFILFGLFELFIAQIMGPGNSDELVTGGPVVIPWFGLPLVAIGSAGAAVAGCRRFRFAYRALAIAAACLAAWFVLAVVL